MVVYTAPHDTLLDVIIVICIEHREATTVVPHRINSLGPDNKKKKRDNNARVYRDATFDCEKQDGKERRVDELGRIGRWGLRFFFKSLSDLL